MQTSESLPAQSTYYIDIIRNNFKQVQEAYFGTNAIEENVSELQTTKKNVNERKL